jgi:hypothetical protein
MKLLDRIALNSLIKTITNFILAVIKIFAPKPIKEITPKKRRPIKDLLDKVFKND